MSKCYTCGNSMPDKDLTDLLLSMEKYREEFEDWDEDEPVLLCTPCYEERQDGS